ncbi:hypothetical protein RCZ04_20570 [Capnocytophaga sp. HP1101]
MLRDNTTRAKNAILMLWISFAFLFVILISDIFELSVIRGFLIDEIDEDLFARAELSDLFSLIVGLLWLVITLIMGILFLMWFRRAYYNLHQLKNNLSYTDGWAVGSWFIPFANWVLPYRIMKEIYDSTRNLFIQKGDIQPKLSTNIVTIWWTLSVITSIVNYLVFRAYMFDEPTIEISYTTSIINVIGTLLLIVCFFLCIKVVKDYAKVEPLLSNLQQKEETNTNIL